MIDQKMRDTFEAKLNDMASLISRIDERSKITNDEVHDLHRQFMRENQTPRTDNGRSHP